MSQKLSPSPEWVTIAKVHRGGVDRRATLGGLGGPLLGALAARAAAPRQCGAEHRCQHGAHRTYACPNPCHEDLPFSLSFTVRPDPVQRAQPPKYPSPSVTAVGRGVGGTAEGCCHVGEF
ncbi:hypothetical protein GCM10020000_16530 [Streptomyces olivoverticillatus]